MGISCPLLAVGLFVVIFASQPSFTHTETPVTPPFTQENTSAVSESHTPLPETPVYVQEASPLVAELEKDSSVSYSAESDRPKEILEVTPLTSNPPSTKEHIPLYSSSLLPSHPPLVDDVWRLLQRSQQVYSWKSSSKPASAEAAAGKSEEDMPSFEEWRQQKLELVEKEKSNHTTSSNDTGRRRRRVPIKNTNYASAVCGAKVIAHNPELENPGAILTANRDDYMLTPCKVARRFFVVELCERIHVHSFDIGNLELFSATPKKIHVFGASRFPSRDWVDFGQFLMSDSRDVQNFTVPAGMGFVKYIRVEMMEHHGTEHYCPVTVFRVSGTSMMDEYVYSEDTYEDDDDDDPSRPPLPPERINEDAYMESDKWTGNGLLHSVNPITMAKNLVKRFVSSGYNLIHPTDPKNVTPAPCRNSTGNSSYRPTNITEVALTSDRTSGSNFAHLRPDSPLLGLCFDQQDGWNVTSSSCQYVWCLLQASKASLAFCPSLGTKYSSLPPSSSPSSSYSNLSNAPLSLQVPIIPPLVETLIVRPEVLPSFEASSAPEDQVVPSVAALPCQETSAVVTSPSLGAESNLLSGTASVVVQQEAVKSVVDSKSVSGEAEVKGSVEVPIQVSAVQKSSTVGNGVLKDHQAVHEHPAVLPASNGTSSNQQGSVFVKLDNRLKVLELNMSLSGQYLHELSRRFKKQNEDSVKNFTGVFQKLSDLMLKESSVQATVLAQLETIKRETTLLQLQVTSLREDIHLWRWILPVGCSLVLVLLVVVLAVMIPRYIESTVRRAVQRHALSAVTSNGHLNTKLNGIVHKREENLFQHLPNNIAQTVSSSQPSVASSTIVVSTPTVPARKHKKRKRDRGMNEGLMDRMVPVPDRLSGSRGDST
ncbi:hypothetical protein RvY_17460 [Ramazzottius varieornatus]|uniref:SUN domain-containing protein n=1 Tax=Ramazzottius varieornatus TaxID=947166 RepID=A0A1D1W267_RAMVA|nr:hypothetical protein RvY_17460 [Ramazzottius varieornatus]